MDDELVVHHRVHRTWRGADRKETLEIFVEAVEEVRAAVARTWAPWDSASRRSWIRRTGASLWSNHLPLDDVPFRDLMSERLGLPVYVDNDSNLSMLAEHRRGAARDARHALMVALGTGIGGGILIDGRIYRGATGVGAELGHVVVDIDGADCPGNCPGRGCLEVLVSGNAIGLEGLAAAGAQPDSGARAAACNRGATSPAGSSPSSHTPATRPHARCWS